VSRADIPPGEELGPSEPRAPNPPEELVRLRDSASSLTLRRASNKVARSTAVDRSHERLSWWKFTRRVSRAAIIIREFTSRDRGIIARRSLYRRELLEYDTAARKNHFNEDITRNNKYTGDKLYFHGRS